MVKFLERRNNLGKIKDLTGAKIWFWTVLEEQKIKIKQLCGYVNICKTKEK